MELLKKISSIDDLKKLSIKELPVLAQEIRKYIEEVISNNGGHLASNLGVVELTIALHYVYDSPIDKIIFDVGHQSYVHKILTGRREELKTLRTEGGISGFPKAKESEHDVFDTGHGSTSISAGLGYAHARDLSGEDYNVVSVIGDGALTGGMAFEALNDAGDYNKKMLIIVNDNKMSISKNVGGVSKHLSRLRLKKGYVKFKHALKHCTECIPLVGKPFARLLERGRNLFRFMVIKNKMFDQLGLKYIGPIDGHNIKMLISYLTMIKNLNCPVVLHVLTRKGKGNEAAENNPSAFHGVGFEDSSISFSKTAGEELCEIAKTNNKITVFSAAMPIGTGMQSFQDCNPERFFDVGIAEEHAVTCAAGMAKAGFKPYVAIYSTFLQRAYDQILHDVCLQNLPVTFLIDRAGIVGEDGSTHQGIYDLSFLSSMPNMTIAAPKDVAEFKKLIKFSTSFNSPLAIRYPKCSFKEFDTGAEIETGKWEIVAKGSEKVAILALGNHMQILASELSECKIINPIFVKPLDFDMLNSLYEDNYKIIILEENTDGGLFSAVSAYYSDKRMTAMLATLHIPSIVMHGSISSTFDRLGITVQALKDLKNNF